MLKIPIFAWFMFLTFNRGINPRRKEYCKYSLNIGSRELIVGLQERSKNTGYIGYELKRLNPICWCSPGLGFYTEKYF